jgi:hypothetical protein
MQITGLTVSSMEKPQEPRPGISRDERISTDGLERLERLLASGSKLNEAILDQWIRRYGEAAEALIARYHLKKQQ